MLRVRREELLLLVRLPPLPGLPRVSLVLCKAVEAVRRVAWGETSGREWQKGWLMEGL